MKNYLSKHYARYYILTDDGQSIETTRAECIAPGDSQTADSPYKQRWFYDGENYSYIVRLPRNEQSEALHRMSEQYTQNEERCRARKYACVLKGTGGCDNDCGNCQRERFPRIIELDKPLSSDGENDDGELQYFDIAAEDSGYAAIEENDAFFAAIAELTEQQKELAKMVFIEGRAVTEIAAIQGVDKSAISHRLERIYKRLQKK